MNLFSFFSGAGFLDLGFEKAGFHTSFVNENHTPFADAYVYARKNLDDPIAPPNLGIYTQSIVEFLSGSLKKRLADLIQDQRTHSDLVGFIGGPPCPDFSVGGKNRGRDGDNGKLSDAYIQLICQQKPDFFLFENVKGLWSTKVHRTFYEELKMKLQKNGYITTDCLINSIEYGAAQDRERIILLGFRKNILTKDQYIYDKKTKKYSLQQFSWGSSRISSRDHIFDVDWPTIDPFSEDSILSQPNNIPVELTVESWFDKNDVINHANAIHHFQPRAALTRFQSIPEGDSSRKSFKRLHRWRYSPTAAYGNNEVHLHPYKARRITVAEALAIQSLPKDFTLPPYMTLSNMFKTIGNGVPYVAAHAIANTIRAFLRI